MSDPLIDPDIKNGPFSSLMNYFYDTSMSDILDELEEDELIKEAELIEKDEMTEEDFRISIQEALSNPELF